MKNKKHPSDAIRRGTYLADKHWEFLLEEAEKTSRTRSFVLREILDTEIERRKKLKDSMPKKED